MERPGPDNVETILTMQRPEAGSYKDGGKVAQKPTFWKAGFSPK